MRVYIVWTPHSKPLECYSTQRRADVLVEVLTRDGCEAYVEPMDINDSSPEPVHKKALGAPKVPNPDTHKL